MALSLSTIKQAIRAGNFSSVGSYPVFLLSADGETYHPACLRTEYRDVVENAITDGYQSSSWTIEAIGPNWESTDMYCPICNECIDSAYGLTEGDLQHCEQTYLELQEPCDSPDCCDIAEGGDLPECDCQNSEIVMLSNGYGEVYHDGDVVQNGRTVATVS